MNKDRFRLFPDIKRTLVLSTGLVLKFTSKYVFDLLEIFDGEVYVTYPTRSISVKIFVIEYFQTFGYDITKYKYHHFLQIAA